MKTRRVTRTAAEVRDRYRRVSEARAKSRVKRVAWTAGVLLAWWWWFPWGKPPEMVPAPKPVHIYSAPGVPWSTDCVAPPMVR